MIFNGYRHAIDCRIYVTTTPLTFQLLLRSEHLCRLVYCIYYIFLLRYTLHTVNIRSNV